MKHRKFIVIARDFFRGHPPVKYEIMAWSRDDAMSRVAIKDSIKEVLDVRENLIWDKETVVKYWKMYSDVIEENKITEEYLSYIPMR